jgi:hypothetical protein
LTAGGVPGGGTALPLTRRAARIGLQVPFAMPPASAGHSPVTAGGAIVPSALEEIPKPPGVAGAEDGNSATETAIAIVRRKMGAVSGRIRKVAPLLVRSGLKERFLQAPTRLTSEPIPRA